MLCFKLQNDIADLVTDGLRVQRCHVKELKNKRKVNYLLYPPVFLYV